MSDPDSHESAGGRERGNVWAWQRSLLPLMSGLIVVLGMFFLAASLYQLYALQSTVTHAPFTLDETFSGFEASSPGVASQSDYLRLKLLALLEHTALEKRYHQANSVMLARVWTRYLGFLTGMILALVGATFILGRLKEDATSIATEHELLKASLRTSSPGIVLAFLGTVLMLTTILVRFELSTSDVAVYFDEQRSSLELLSGLSGDPDELDRVEAELFGETGAVDDENSPGTGSPER